MSIADITSAIQLALRRTSGTSRTRSRSPIRTQLSSPASSSLSSSAVARARSKSPSRKSHTNKSLLDLVTSQGGVSAAASSASPLPVAHQRVASAPLLTAPVELTPTTTATKVPSPSKPPLRSNSPTLSYLILLVALALTLLAPTSLGLPLGAAAPMPAHSSDHLETALAPTLTTGSLPDAHAADASLLAWFPKLWHSISGMAPSLSSGSTSGGTADPLESMVALFGPWDDDEWQHQVAAGADGKGQEHEHLDADEAWFHCGGKARFMTGLRKADGEVVVSAPKCPKSQSTSARVAASSDGNDKNRVHIASGAGLPVETAYLSAETLRGTLLYSRPAMVTPHTEL